jgi:elongation factor P
MRGRVLAVDRATQVAVVGGERSDARVAAQADWRPGDLVFMDQSNYEQVTIAKDMVGDAHDLMKDNLPCTVVFFNERPVDVTLPTFVFLEVTASEPGVRGDTSGNVQKPATVETGAEISVPLFIRIGDMIKIDTRTHEYVERVAK